MTVCIAAIYPNAISQRCIAILTDMQRTDESTGRKSDTAYKFRWVADNAIIMGSGDLDRFDTLCSKIIPELEKRDNLPLIEDVVNCFLWAENLYRKEYIKRHVLWRYEAIQESLSPPESESDTKTEKTSDFLKYAEEQTRDIEVPFSNDVIVAGFDGEHPILYKITPQSPPDNRTERRYAIIGEGDSVAEIELDRWFLLPMQGAAEALTLFTCYNAKRRSEVIASVGNSTGLVIFHHNGHIESVPYLVRRLFSEAYDKLEREIQNNEKTAHDHIAQNYEKEAGKISGQIINRTTWSKPT